MLNSSQVMTWTVVVALVGMATELFITPVHAAALSADPADVHAPTPPVTYESPFARVRRLNDASVGDWRQAHAPAVSSPAPSVASDPHAGHAGHSGK